MKASELSITEFRRKVYAHLHGAIASVPNKVPFDVVEDPIAHAMMEHLTALDELLYCLGSEERDKERAERDRKLKLEAKRRNPQLEELVCRLDSRVQHAMVALGSEAAYMIMPMDADLCVSAFVQFLDAFPAQAFAMSRPLPPDFPSSRDSTVASIIAAMRIRKEHQQ